MRIAIQVIVLIAILSSCADFIEIDSPRTDLVRSTVFKNEASAKAAMVDIYYQLHLSGFASGDDSSISGLCSLSADELVNGITFSQEYQQFNTNQLKSTNTRVLALWSDMYKCIYKTNAIIEGLKSQDSNVSDDLKSQLIAEAKFIRAFCHFYLLNLFGDVPLIITTDYRINQSIGRTQSLIVYDQIVSDLIVAYEDLPDNFSISFGERTRPNKTAATALLARIFLYRGEWALAEMYASEVIAKSDLYQLISLQEVFLKNSTESIWQLTPASSFVRDIMTFLFTGHQLTPNLINQFETNDQRKVFWIGNGQFGPYDYPLKYKDYQTMSEYSMVLRLAEQYLIRAEARAQQDRITGIASAEEDLNAIRARAGLSNTSASTKDEMLMAILHERQVELFTEWGHRWLDLKRTNQTDNILGPFKTSWQSTAALYPIPEAQILNDPSMANAQNPGY